MYISCINSALMH